MTEKLPEIPDPQLPEHLLIRSAAILPAISPNLRQRVLTDCRHQIRIARWKFRIQAGIAVVTVCALGFLAVGLLRHHPAAQTEPPSVSVQKHPDARSPGDSRPTPGVESSIASEEGLLPTPPVPKNQRQRIEPREIEQIQFLIEELRQREKRLCGLFPGI